MFCPLHMQIFKKKSHTLLQRAENYMALHDNSVAIYMYISSSPTVPGDRASAAQIHHSRHGKSGMITSPLFKIHMDKTMTMAAQDGLMRRMSVLRRKRRQRSSFSSQEHLVFSSFHTNTPGFT
jgi:hypothetical protein